MSLLRPAVLSIDIGSSSVRACLFDERGTPAAGTASRRTHRFVFAGGGRVEADPDALAGLVEQCIDETLQGPAAADHRVAAVACATFLHGMIGADREGRALTPVITWADSRSIEQSVRLGSMIDPEELLQSAAAKALGETKSPAAVAPLGEALADSDPAMQYRAVLSLQQATGKDFGTSVERWQQYVKQQRPQEPGASLANRDRSIF